MAPSPLPLNDPKVARAHLSHLLSQNDLSQRMMSIMFFECMIAAGFLASRQALHLKNEMKSKLSHERSNDSKSNNGWIKEGRSL